VPTAREIRESNEREKLIQSLDDEAREMVESGEWKITGENNGRAVIVDAGTGRWVKGTARPANANDPAEVARATAYKRTPAWREAWQNVFHLGGEDGGVGFEALVEKLWWAVNGAKQVVDCPHLDCQKKHVVAFKPDPKVMMQMVESLIGRMSHVEVEGKFAHLHAMLEQQGEAPSSAGMEFYATDPKGPNSPEERRRVLEADGTLDPSWFDDEDAEMPQLPPPPDPPPPPPGA